MFSKYGFFGSFGFATRGKLADKLPVGDYKVKVVNQNYRSMAADISLNFYATEEMPDIPIGANGEPIPPKYEASGKIVMGSTPGAGDYATCNGVYYQTKN